MSDENKTEAERDVEGHKLEPKTEGFEPDVEGHKLEPKTEGFEPDVEGHKLEQFKADV